MKALFPFFIVFIIVVFGGCEPKGQEEYDNYSKIFFNKYKAEGIDNALNYILSTNPLINASDQQFLNLKKELNETATILGKYYGYDLITTKKASNNFVYRSYLIKYNRQPLRFTFVFYKPSEKWVLHKFTFDNDIEKELENSGSIYFISN